MASWEKKSKQKHKIIISNEDEKKIPYLCFLFDRHCQGATLHSMVSHDHLVGNTLQDQAQQVEVHCGERCTLESLLDHIQSGQLALAEDVLHGSQQHHIFRGFFS